MGGNDFLRGLDPRQTRENPQIPPAVGAEHKDFIMWHAGSGELRPAYRQQFDLIYPELAYRFNTGFYPFFLHGVALNPKFNQPDGLHPNKAGVEVITQSVLPSVLSVLDED